MSRALVIKGANFETNRVAHVNFSGVPCTAVAFNSATYNVDSMSVGTEMVITKTPADTTDEAVFSVSDSTVARVEGNMLYAVGFGTATVTVTCGSATATATITVSSITFTPEKLNGRIQALSSWGDVNPLQYTANSSYDAFARSSSDVPVTAPERITGDIKPCVILIPANTYKIRIESPTKTNWQITVRYTTTDSNLSYGGIYYAKFISSKTYLVPSTSANYTEFTDIPSGADSFAFETGHMNDDYIMNVIFTPAA